MLTRREVLIATATGLAGCSLGRSARPSDTAPNLFAPLPARFAELEAQVGGRLGVAVLDTTTGNHAEHRGDERFPMCSTFKFLAAAAVLARVDRGQEQLERRVSYRQEDLVTYSPITEKHVGGEGMSLAEICEAAVALSDNTAGNLMLANIGGPAGLTAFVRTLGDDVTRLDRNEPTLNTSEPGDPRDTTSPLAMLGSLRALVLGDALSPTSRERLTGWLVGNQTGDARIRAGLPAGWRVGDKTGTGQRGSTNDVAIVWPPGRAPVLIACYLTETEAPAEKRNAVHAEVARAVAGALRA